MKRKRRRQLGGAIHNRIAALRLKRGLSQAEVATALEVDKSAVSHWETGYSRPDMSRIPALAELLKCTTDELLEAA